LRNPSLILVAALMLAPAISMAADATTAKYDVTKTVSLGLPDRWDYVVFDLGSQRVYVAHGSKVSVVDGKEGALLGEIGEIPGGTHGIAVSHATGRGYTDDGKAGTAVSFDLSTLKPLKTINAQPDADGIVFDPASGHAFVINGDSGSVTVIDPKTDSVVATIAAGGGLEFGVADGKGELFVNGAEKQEIVRIDTASNKMTANWPIPNCKSPHGLAIDPTLHRLFSTCVNGTMAVMDTDTGKKITALPIGDYSDSAAFDPKRKLIFSANGDGTLSVILEKDAQTYVSLGSIKTPIGARTMSIDPKTGRLYLAAADVATIGPPLTPGGRPHVVYKPGSLKLLFLDPVH